MLDWITRWIRKNPMHIAEDAACTAIPELKNLMEFNYKMQEEKFNCGVPKTLHSFILLQLAYIHDMLGILVAHAHGNGDPSMAVVARVAFDPSFNWVDYVNTLNAGLHEAASRDRTPEELAEIERLTNILVQSVHVFIPLRQKLASELRKVGVVWK